MIEVAQERLKKSESANNVTFEQSEMVQWFEKNRERKFDAGTICLALHEMPKSYRLPLVQGLLRNCKVVYLIDFEAQMPWNFSGKKEREKREREKREKRRV
jgi:hypothetical protein